MCGDLSLNRQFNELKPILMKNPEWARELKLFQSLIKDKRTLDPQRQKSRAERREVARFLKRMTRRVDAELAADVAYRLLEQELIRKREYLGDLMRFRRQLAIEIRLERRPRDRRIEDLKREFIESIWQQRARDSRSKTSVTPFLPRRLGS